jgi:hypothetical protein
VSNNFFIDKTHTDINGRLCLEPLQFTLGIFNRTIRGQPRAWRTLGYVNDLQLPYKKNAEAKLQDYHLMLKVLLRSFMNAQKVPIIWEFKSATTSKFYRLKIPVMFVIGDTEGHDKLCGRYSNRTKSQSLCRYCNIPFEKTDDPFFKFNYIKANKVKRLVLRKDKDALKAMSMHCINNAWHEVDFCDPERGIHGATLAEVLHCIQQGIFEYGIISLFQQKKELKNKAKKRKLENNVKEENDEESDDNDNESESKSEESEDNEGKKEEEVE